VVKQGNNVFSDFSLLNGLEFSELNHRLKRCTRKSSRADKFIPVFGDLNPDGSQEAFRKYLEAHQ